MSNKNVFKFCPFMAAVVIGLTSVSLANAEQKPISSEPSPATYNLADSQTDKTTPATYSADMKASDGSCITDTKVPQDATMPSTDEISSHHAMPSSDVVPSSDAVQSTDKSNTNAVPSTDKNKSANW